MVRPPPQSRYKMFHPTRKMPSYPFAVISRPMPLAPATTDWLSVPIVLSLLECPRGGSIQYKDFRVWPPPLRTLLSRFIQLVPVSWVPSGGQSGGCATIGLSIHPSVDIEAFTWRVLILPQLCRTAVTKYQRLKTADVYFYQFWRLEVRGQGASRFSVW